MLWKKRRARKAVGCSGEHSSIVAINDGYFSKVYVRGIKMLSYINLFQLIDRFSF
jgi:hypothetical protein